MPTKISGVWTEGLFQLQGLMVFGIGTFSVARPLPYKNSSIMWEVDKLRSNVSWRSQFSWPYLRTICYAPIGSHNLIGIIWNNKRYERVKSNDGQHQTAPEPENWIDQKIGGKPGAVLEKLKLQTKNILGSRGSKCHRVTLSLRFRRTSCVFRKHKKQNIETECTYYVCS